MKKEGQLLLARNIFVFIVFISLGIIVATEKSKIFLTSKFEKEIDNYIETNYNDIKNEIKINNSTYKNGIYKVKVTSKKNKNLYFLIKKDNKKITDSYQKDYLEGKTLFTYLNKKLKREIKEKTKTDITVIINSKLNQHTPPIQERILKEENLLELTFYTIKRQIIITDWNSKIITNKIIDTINLYNSNNIYPKNYDITIINKDNIKETIQIQNLTTDFINNISNEKIIEDILNDNNSKLLKENNITYEYIDITKEEK